MYDGAIYAHLESSFRDREVIPGQMVFPSPFTVKGALVLFLFNQRLRHSLRQRLRRVNKASAARQRGRRPCFFVDIIFCFFPDFDIISQQ